MEALIIGYMVVGMAHGYINVDIFRCVVTASIEKQLAIMISPIVLFLALLEIRAGGYDFSENHTNNFALGICIYAVGQVASGVFLLMCTLKNKT